MIHDHMKHDWKSKAKPVNIYGEKPVIKRDLVTTTIVIFIIMVGIAAIVIGLNPQWFQ